LKRVKIIRGRIFSWRPNFPTDLAGMFCQELATRMGQDREKEGGPDSTKRVIAKRDLLI
jgi:hypothetical protein